ncbi:uncharacterized protein LOC108630014 [Ceratina calcarata]|uniref:Uncharacterized protein LOC108630014 n=1 Tax=Ceratina calcarata TaxID=156304 RepID=A0AAJ7JAP7_9HYME|nr:uncharacterized protein LOC108630014 [Ceratina calcarata]
MATPKKDILGRMRLDVFILAHLERSNRIGNIKTNMKKKSKSEYTVDYVRAQLDILEKEWDGVQSRHACLIASATPEQREKLSYFKAKHMDDYERVFHETAGYIYEQIRTLERQEAQEARAASGEYAGQGHTTYRASAVTNNPTLSDAQRLQYLKAALEGDALRTVSTLELTNENFSIAWATLEKRYNNPRLIQTSWFKKVFHLKPVKHDNIESITQITIGLQQALDALPKLGVPVDQVGPFLVFYISSQFDEELLAEWEQTFDDARKFPAFNEMMCFLENKVSAIFAAKDMHNKPNSSKSEKKKVRSHATNVETRARESTSYCSFCQQQHRITDCNEFRQRDAQGRYFWIRANNMCTRCLSEGRTLPSCRSTIVCDKCGASHHTLLHCERKTRPLKGKQDTPRRDDRGGKKEHRNAPNSRRELQAASSKQPVSMHCDKTADQPKGINSVLLATALIRVYGPNGKSRYARALLNQGSEMSFISADLAN